MTLVGGLVLVTSACVAGGSKDNASGSGAKLGDVFRLGIVEPTAIDPYNAHESEVENVTRFEGANITKAVFEGLVKVDLETSELTPGVAKTWGHNPACSQWTFDLRSGTKFSNGEVVTARSFIDGMTRAAAATSSDTAHFIDGIEGYAAVHGGVDGSAPTTPALSGLSAPDDHTLVVTLARPNCEFDKLVLQPVFSPVPSEAGKADPTSAYYGMPVGNGPFKMREPWTHNASIVLVRNNLYYGTKAHLDEVDFTILAPDKVSEAEYANFRAGKADWARIPPTVLGDAKAAYKPRKEFIAEPRFGVNYLQVNVVNPPLNNVKARQAISLAIDRDAVINSVFKGFQTKAASLLPPALSAFYQPGVCTVCDKADPAKARQLAKEGGIPPGTSVRFSFNTGGGHEEWVQAVAQQLRETLGLEIDLQGMPFRDLVAKEEAPDATGLYRASWGTDSPSADGFLRPLLSAASFPPGDNRGRYANPRFDALLDRALKATDKGEKVKLTKQAEKMAIGDDLALIPMWYRTQYRVFSNRFTHVSLDPFENPTLADIRLS
ncbi:MAG: ABC transporter substrate-binding protein [Actinomycetota bacterium]|nr:ABC transporter substrate-binding protein [Actinomycetota bacterium]